MPQLKVRSSNLDVIQVFRGLAAFAVVVHHAAGLVMESPAFLSGQKTFWLGRFVNTDVGAIGVDLFFVISGFIMSYTSRRGGWRESSKFLERRIVRIYPFYWLCNVFAIGVLVSPWVQQFHPHAFDLIKSLLLYPTLYQNLVRPVVLGQGWTLIYEMLFYFLFALTLRQTRIKQMFSVGGALLVMYVSAWQIPGQNAGLVLLRDQVLFEFVLGIVLGLLFSETSWRINRALSWTVISIGLIWLIPSAVHGGWGWEVPRLAKFGVPATLIIAGCVLNRSIANTAFPKGLTVLGDASYSLYLTHSIVMTVFSALYLRSTWLRKLPLDFYLLAMVAAMVSVGIVVYFMAEKPLLRWCRRGIDRMSPAAEPKVSSPAKPRDEKSDSVRG